MYPPGQDNWKPSSAELSLSGRAVVVNGLNLGLYRHRHAASVAAMQTGAGSPIQLPAAAQWDLPSRDGKPYRIQVAWPMHWASCEGHADVPVL